ncbi:MAG: lamin tail domain-containing protein [Myxococcota bacterium]
MSVLTILTSGLVGGCNGDPGPLDPDPQCGDGVVDSTEDCDSTSFGAVERCGDLPGLVGDELQCTEDCTLDDTLCLSPSTWVQAVRETEDATDVALPVAKVWVTRTRGALGSEPPGFYVQADQGGPALYVTAGGLEPAPSQGDEVIFTVTGVTTVDGVQRVTMIDDWAVASSGNDVTGLAEDLSSDASFLDALDDVESELVQLTATLLTDPAGTEVLDASISTPGYPEGSTSLILRGEAELVEDTLDLQLDCTITFQAVMGRFVGAEDDLGFPTLLHVGDVTASACNPPQVLHAEATSPTEVLVTFDRNIDDESLDVADFSFTDGLTATAVAGDEAFPERVVVTTSSQVPALYAVTVSDIEDTLGSSLDPTGDNPVYFRGFGTARPEAASASLVITQYIEGTGFNKAVEITNVGPAGSSADLSGCLLEFYVNGDTKVFNIYSYPDTSLPGGSSYTICNGSIDAVVRDTVCAGTFGDTDGTVNHNGDDSYLLRCDGLLVDSFGQLGVDPGTSWDTTHPVYGDLSSRDQTLRRSCFVTAGDIGTGDDFAQDLNDEWVPFPINDFDDLGTDLCP